MQTQRLQFPDTEFFHFKENDHKYPKFPEFAGYPVRALIYWDIDDVCIMGLALVYKDRYGNSGNFDDFTVWFSGSVEAYNISDNPTNIELSGRVENVSGSVLTNGSITCLASMQFQ